MAVKLMIGCCAPSIAGEVMALRREEGNFMLDVWAPPLAISRKLGFTGHP